MSTPAPAPARARALLFSAIFLSGAAGLMHEIVWARMLAALIGSTAHAQVAVLAVFMGGLALGAAIFGRRSDRRPRPLRTYARLEHLLSGDVANLRRGAGRALTLLLLAPAVLPVWVLWRNPNFHSWTQGQMPVVPLLAVLILLGPLAVVLAARILLGRRLPFRAPEERVMVLWGGTVLLLSQANRFTSSLTFSPQLLITSLAPIVVLAVPAIAGPPAAPEGPVEKRRRRGWAVLAVLALALPSSAMVLARRCRDAAADSSRFVSEGETKAWEWLAREVDGSDLILSTASSGTRLPRHVSAHVLAGHWSLTPDVVRRTDESSAFFSGQLSPGEAARYLRRHGVDWVWVGPEEQRLGGWSRPDFARGCAPYYERLGVRIYRCGGGR